MVTVREGLSEVLASHVGPEGSVGVSQVERNGKGKVRPVQDTTEHLAVTSPSVSLTFGTLAHVRGTGQVSYRAVPQFGLA